MDSMIGATLGNRFLLIEKLGEGAMAEVFLAEHEHLGRRYAIKVLKSAHTSNPEMVGRFRREARSASRLNHPSIVSITDFGQTPQGRFYLVMDYTPGKNLFELMQEFPEHLMPLPRALRLLRQIADALSAAHDAGVIHRDLKPDNVLVAQTRWGADLPKILDFGLSKTVVGSDQTHLTKTGEVFGTPLYMSPEQARAERVDSRADIYSLGVMAFELCTGRPPFTGRNLAELLIAHQERQPPHPATLRPAHAEPLPDALVRIILACLEKAPERRPTRATDLIKVIDKCLGDQERSPRESVTQVKRVSAAFLGKVNTAVMGLPTNPTHMALDPLSTMVPRSEPPKDGEWRWNRIAKQAKTLAQALREKLLGPVQLSRTLASLAELEDRILATETELALLVSQQEELDTAHRSRVAQLRRAILDLRVERDQAAMAGPPDQNLLAELDYQIGELERRLAAVFTEHESRSGRLATNMQTQRGTLQADLEQQQEAELSLVRDLQRCRPRDSPREIQTAYDELETALRSFR